MSGCQVAPRLSSDERGAANGKTFYLGGAGPIGNVTGVRSVPAGLRRGGYRGAIEVFGWQSVLGGTLRDQMDARRNHEAAQRLANRIINYLDAYPGNRVNLIGLSAGTGIITWALENLPEEYRVGQVVYFGSSLSRDYDLTRMFRGVDGVLWNFYSTNDPILKYGVPLTGSVDRKFAGENLAGLHGFAPPAEADETTQALYRRHLRNMPWQPEYAEYGYHGQHTDGVNADFVASIVTVLIDPADAPSAALPRAVVGATPADE